MEKRAPCRKGRGLCEKQAPLRVGGGWLQWKNGLPARGRGLCEKQAPAVEGAGFVKNGLPVVGGADFDERRAHGARAGRKAVIAATIRTR